MIFPKGEARSFPYGNGSEEGFNSSSGSCDGNGKKYTSGNGSGTGYGYLSQYRGDGYGYGFSTENCSPRGTGYGEYPYDLIQYWKEHK